MPPRCSGSPPEKCVGAAGPGSATITDKLIDGFAIGSGRARLDGGLGFEVARPIAVEPTMAQPEAVAEDLLEHLPFHGADRAIDLRQGEIRAGVLAEDRQEPAVPASDLRLDPPIVEDRAELDHPTLPFIAADLLAILLGEPVGDAAE